MSVRSTEHWLSHHLPASAASAAAGVATAEAARWSGIALVAQMSPPAAQQLRECGLSDEHAALGSAELLPLLQEMVSARAASAHSAVAALRPKAGMVPERARLLLDGPPPPPPLPAAVSAARVLLVVARYREDVSWLGRLPAGVIFHVLQKGGALQPELPTAQQSALPNVGREAHSYLSFLAERAHDEAAPLPPMLVCTQADPFPHNPRLLDELARLADAAEQSGDRLPPFVPLGRWSGGERMVVCDTSGAPHQPKLLPLHATWRALFGPAAPPPPLWLAFTPGAIFAVSRQACRARPAEFYARATEVCGLAVSADPISGHAFERLWWYIFDPDAMCAWQRS